MRSKFAVASRSGLAGGHRLDSQRVNALLHQVADGLEDQPLALESIESREGVADDSDRKVALSGAVVSGVPRVLVAFVLQEHVARRESCLEPLGQLGRDGALDVVVHAEGIGQPRLVAQLATEHRAAGLLEKAGAARRRADK